LKSLKLVCNKFKLISPLKALYCALYLLFILEFSVIIRNPHIANNMNQHERVQHSNKFLSFAAFLLNLYIDLMFMMQCWIGWVYSLQLIDVLPLTKSSYSNLLMGRSTVFPRSTLKFLVSRWLFLSFHYSVVYDKLFL